MAAGKKGLVQTQLLIESSKASGATKGSPRGRPRKERVVIPGERSSPRKRRTRGTMKEVPEEVLEEEQEEEKVDGLMAMEKDKALSELEEGVELDEDTFLKVRKYY